MFKALSELSDRHLLHQAVTTGFSRIESFRSLDWDLFKFTNLSDQFGFLSELGSLFILALLETLLKITVHLVSNRLVLLLLDNDLLCGGLFRLLNLRDHLLLLFDDFLQVDFALFHHGVHVLAHIIDESMVLALLVLTSLNGELPGHLHFYLFLCYLLETFNLVFLGHLRLPSIELRSVFQAHCHFIDLLLEFPLFLVNQVLLTLERRSIQFDICCLLLKVRHRSRLVETFGLELLSHLLLHLLLDLLEASAGRPGFGRQLEPLLRVPDVVAANRIRRRLSALLLLFLDVSERLLVHILGQGSGFDLFFDLLGRWDHLRLLFRQIKWHKLSAFRLLLLLFTWLVEGVGCSCLPGGGHAGPCAFRH